MKIAIRFCDHDFDSNFINEWVIGYVKLLEEDHE